MKLEDKDSRNIAVIDLGSNTFHLVISRVKLGSSEYSIIHRQRIFSYLSRDGIEYLSEETISDCISHFGDLYNICIDHQVQEIRAIGTSALRSASNAGKFLDAIYDMFKIQIEVIDGNRESELIYKGLSQSKIDHCQVHLMIDIGGGSVEFIIAYQQRILFSQSYNIGISVIKNQFRKTDPISDNENNMLFLWLDRMLSDLLEKCDQYKPLTLIGASGPFEIIESYCKIESQPEGNHVVKETVILVAEEIIKSTINERIQLDYMPESRGDLSRESMLIVSYLYNRIQSLEGLIISPYTLKEGLLSDII